MKLRNKKTGEVYTACRIIFGESIEGLKKNQWKTLEEFNEDWEDYEEPKEFWFVDSGGEVEEATYLTDNDKSSLRSFGNYFETKEEAEKAVEKLKALERLKDIGFKFEGWTIDDGLRISICTNFDSDGIYDDGKKQIKSDLDICFGGEE